MKRRWLISISLLLAAGVIFFAFKQREPRYQGQTLTQWIDRAGAIIEHADSDLKEPDTLPEWHECRVALRCMKKEALPILDEWIQAKDSKAKLRITRWLRQRDWFGFGNRLDRAVRCHILAVGGYYLLGEEAEASVPLLMRMTEEKDYERRFLAFQSLYAVKPAKNFFFPVAMRLLRDSDPAIRIASAELIMERYPEEAEALQLQKQLRLLGSTNWVMTNSLPSAQREGSPVSPAGR